MGAEYSGLTPGHFMGVEEGAKHYGLEFRDNLFASDTHNSLAERGIASVEMPISEADFKILLDAYEVCIQDFPQLLHETAHKVDARFGFDVGHVRKERKFNSRLGLQTQDPKNLFHFNEYARLRWLEEFASAPEDFIAFLEAGYAIHSELVLVARRQFEDLEETHPGLTESHFPGEPGSPSASHSYLRVLRYDPYPVRDDLGEVAKAHFDISGATIQAYADAPGFWGTIEGRDGPRTHFDTEEEMAYFFLGRGYKKLYGDNTPLKPLYHGVDRVIPEDAEWVPARHAVILFVDAPFINYDVKPDETLPEIY